MKNDSLLKSIADEMLESKTNEELYELANKFCKGQKFFNNFEKFAEYLDNKLTKSEIIKLLSNSEIGYDAQIDKVCVGIKDDKPITLFIPSCDYDDEDWMDNIRCNIRYAIVECLREKMTTFVEDIMK